MESKLQRTVKGKAGRAVSMSGNNIMFRTKATQERLADMAVSVLEWPSYSGNLSPVKHSR